MWATEASVHNTLLYIFLHDLNRYFINVWFIIVKLFTGFLAATKQLYKWYFLSVCPSVCLSVHLSVYVTIDCSTVLPLVLGVVTRQKPHINGSVVLGADESPWPCSTPSWYTPLSWLILSKQKNLHLFSSQYICVFSKMSVRLSHLFYYVRIIISSWNYQELLPMMKERSMQKVMVRGQKSRSQRSKPNLTVSGL